MQTGKGLVNEIQLQEERAVHISCSPALIPAPGQYLLAQAESETDSPLPLSIFASGTTPKGFFVAAPTPAHWALGSQINLRGPLGRGFQIPNTAKKIALINLNNNLNSLLALLQQAISLNKEITLITQTKPETLPSEIEILSPENTSEAIRWADYVAASLDRNQISTFAEKVPTEAHIYTQLLINSEIPCAGLAECGVCAIRTRKSWLTTCKDGPVFNLSELLN